MNEPSDLDSIFWCEHFGKTLALRHCLRRQVERLEATDPKLGKPKAGPPAKPYCANECAQGREIRGTLSGTPLRACGA